MTPEEKLNDKWGIRNVVQQAVETAHLTPAPKTVEMINGLKITLEEQAKKHVEIEYNLRDIKENHLAHIEPDIVSLKSEINQIKVSTEKMSTNMDWLQRFFWVIATSSIGGLIVAVINLLQK